MAVSTLQLPRECLRKEPILPLDLKDEDPAAFVRQLSNSSSGSDCRLVDCATPSPTHADVLEAPCLSFEEFRRRLAPLIDEFFCAMDVAGMVASVEALGCPSFHDELVASLFRSALDRKEAERGAMMLLLSALQNAGLLTSSQSARGFEKLVLSWNDLRLDVPDAPNQLVALLSSKVGLLDKGLFARLPEGLLRSLLVGLKPGLEQDLLIGHVDELATFKASMAARLETDLFSGRAVEPLVSWLRASGKAAFHHEVVLAACVGSLSTQPATGAFWTSCLDAKGLVCEKCELALAFLAQLHSEEEQWVLDEVDIQLGFSRLLGAAEQLINACPDTEEPLIALLCGAVKRELLPAQFLMSARRMRFGGAYGVEIVRKTQRLTPMYCRRGWGSGDVRQFRKEVQDTISEYFDSKNIQELAQIVDELHFSEKEQVMFVRKLLVAGMEQGRQAVALDAVAELLGRCWSKQEVAGAFEQLRDVASDLVLDMPDCREQTTGLVGLAAGRGLLEKSYLMQDAITIV